MFKFHITARSCGPLPVPSNAVWNDTCGESLVYLESCSLICNEGYDPTPGFDVVDCVGDRYFPRGTPKCSSESISQIVSLPVQRKLKFIETSG